MENISVFQLVAPLVCLTFAVTFVCIHLYNRNRVAPLFFAFSYGAGSFALTIDIFRDVAAAYPVSYLSNTFYMASAAFLVTAFAKHFNKRVPVREMAIICAMTLGIFVWFFEVQDSMTVRTVLMNISGGLMFGLALFIIPSRNTVLINKLVFWVMVLTVAQFFIRTGIVFYVTGETLNAENYTSSLFSKSFHFVVTINSIVLAITLCISMGVSAILDLQRLSQTDALTGLINRRGFEDEAAAAIEAADQNHMPLSLVVCDIDHFKQVNDTYGHSVGDWVIKGFGKVLRERCRHSDLVGRVGGEEFCILLPHANADMAKLVASACRVAFANRQFRNVPAETRFTASFGIAERVQGESYSRLFRRADIALYRAKEGGRNRVEIAENDVCSDHPTSIETAEAPVAASSRGHRHGIAARRNSPDKPQNSSAEQTGNLRQ